MFIHCSAGAAQRVRDAASGSLEDLFALPASAIPEQFKASGYLHKHFNLPLQNMETALTSQHGDIPSLLLVKKYNSYRS